MIESIPLDRLLLESDAPDACLNPLPDRWVQALPDLRALNDSEHAEKYPGLTTPAVVRKMVTLIAVMLSSSRSSGVEMKEEEGSRVVVEEHVIAQAIVENAKRIFLL
jgi:Tat protein secretion system quality control protein TatD with DNase activity